MTDAKTLSSILYIEDEPDIRSIAQIALEDLAGFKLKICSSGQEAISIAKQFTPDLILLDVMMPEMDGPQTLNALRKLPNFENIPAVFMTAKIQPAEINQYKQLGAVGVITKPFDPMLLADQLKAIWKEVLHD